MISQKIPSSGAQNSDSAKSKSGIDKADSF
jgi:hypothetical protein